MAEKTPKAQKKPLYTMRNSITNYYLLVMFTFFELFLTNQYAKARVDKYVLFIVLTVALIVSVSVISLSYKMDKNAPPEQRVVENRPFFALSVTDVAMLVFFFGAVLSTIFSDYALDSLTGNSGRNNGLILIFLYTAMYFIVS